MDTFLRLATIWPRPGCCYENRAPHVVPWRSPAVCISRAAPAAAAEQKRSRGTPTVRATAGLRREGPHPPGCGSLTRAGAPDTRRYKAETRNTAPPTPTTTAAASSTVRQPLRRPWRVGRRRRRLPRHHRGIGRNPFLRGARLPQFLGQGRGENWFYSDESWDRASMCVSMASFCKSGRCRSIARNPCEQERWDPSVSMRHDVLEAHYANGDVGFGVTPSVLSARPD